MDPAGPLPDRTYAKEELRSYLAHDREKCRATIEALTEETAARRCVFGWGEASFAELLLCSMRHVQHHAGQLNLILRQATGSAPRWVARAKAGEAAGTSGPPGGANPAGEPPAVRRRSGTQTR